MPAGCEPVSKTCRGCLKKGHIWVDCLDNVEKVLVEKDGTEDDREDDEECQPQDREREPCSTRTRSS